MNQVYKQVGICLSHVIRNQECPELLTLDVNAIMKEAGKHDIEGLIYKALKPQVDLSAYKQSVILKSLTQASYFKRAIETLSFLQQQGITLVLLKGSVLKQYYPQADLRTMGDVDILVPHHQLDQVHEILTRLGYSKQNSHHEKHDVYDGKGFQLEVHWSLFDASLQSGTQVFEKNLWSRLRVIEIQGIPFYRLGNEDFLVHLIVHMAEHLKFIGFGIRQLCDMVVWMEQNNIDLQDVIKTLAEMKLLTFTTYLMETCHILLDFDVPELFKGSVNLSDLNLFIESLFIGGVHGNGEKEKHFQHYFAYRKNYSNKWSIFFHLLCPSIEDLSKKYRYAHQYSWLLPVAWIHRLFRAIFHQSFNFSEKIYILIKTPYTANKKAKLLQSLGLVE